MIVPFSILTYTVLLTFFGNSAPDRPGQESEDSACGAGRDDHYLSVLLAGEESAVKTLI